MNCKNAQALFSAYVDDELDGREMLGIREHLSRCSECQEEMRCVAGLKRLLGSAPVPEPSANFEDRLVAGVLASKAVHVGHKPVSWLTLTGIAAASMLGTMLFLNSLHKEAPPVSDPRDNTAYEIVQRDQGFPGGTDGLSGYPVMMPAGGIR